MKILTLALVGLTATSMAFAQSTIPNDNFENWTNQGSYDDPDDWTTPNAQSQIAGVTTVTKSTDAPAGMFSVEMTSKFSAVASATIPGGITNGQIIFQLTPFDFQFVGGTPFTVRPTALSGYYKYTPASPEDTGTIMVTLTKWNTGTSMRDIVGTGVFQETDTVSNWTHFDATINYLETFDPDTISIVMLSTTNFDSAAPNAKLMVDTLQHDAVSGIGSELVLHRLNLYPNPATDVIEVNGPNAIADATYLITDMKGAVLRQGTFSGTSARISTSDLASGMYFVDVRSGDRRLAMERFTVR